MENLVLGADIGGSHITTAVIDLDNKIEVKNSWRRDLINPLGSAAEITDGWTKILRGSMEAAGLNSCRIRIAVPGPMDYKKGICRIKVQDKFRALYGLNIKGILAEKLMLDPEDISFHNDAACFLKGELYSGSLYGYEEAIGLTIGTGLGTSHALNGEAFDSDLWKMPFKRGIAEDYISTRWFTKRFAELAGTSIKDVKDLIDNHSGSPFFMTVFAEFSENLAMFMYRFIKKKMPLAAVIGGNIANAENYFMEDTRTQLAKLMGYSFPVRRSALGEKATLLGAGASR